ncbi:MAG TPA: DUF2169 domain-containing protein, partial [Polyangium sp.]|nr:DUF2169 domain-containing protein [Polyangium sp.]
MLILSSGPLRTGSTVWQPRAGSFMLTVVCKTTYWLQPGEAAIAAEQEAVNEADDHWDDDPNRSVRAPSDFMPNKLRPEVTLVGYAYAPNDQPVRSLIARMIVGDVDKSIEVFADRTFLPDGTMHEGTRFTRMRLTWERAGGGPGTSNPVGMRADVRDAYGRRAVPNLQPIGLHVSSRDDFFAPVGFGPIAATWPSRADLLGRTPPAVGEGLEGHSAAYYNAAPADQQLAMLRDNERIVLENLHPKHQRLVTNLPGYHPAIFVERGNGKATRVTANPNSLWIDTDRGIATLTWHASIPLVQQDEPGRVLVTLEPPGREITWNDMLRVISNGSADDDEDEPIDTITTTGSLIQGAGAVLPFAARVEPAPVAPPRELPRLQPNADLPFQPARSSSSLPAVPAPRPPWPSAPPTPPPPPLPTAARAPVPSLPGTLVAPTGSAPLPPGTLIPAGANVPLSTGTLVTSTASAPPPPASPPPPPRAVAPPPPVRASLVSLSEASSGSPEKPPVPASPWAGGAAGGPAAQPQTIGAQLVAASAAAPAPVVELPKETPDAPAKPPAPNAPPARRATSFDAAFGSPKNAPSIAATSRPSTPATSESSTFSAKSASDAAAIRSETAEAPRERSSRLDMGLDDAGSSKRRQAVVN